MELSIKPENAEVEYMYHNHKTFHEGDSGLDLYIPEDIIVPPHAIGFALDHKISCQARGFNTTYPSKYGLKSYYLYPRSGISNTPLRMSNSVGIIDSGYTGNIIMKVDNLSDTPYNIKKGERLAQICSGNLEPFTFRIVLELIKTERGSGGFNSTGK